MLGLNDNFNTIRSQILSVEPLPTLSKVYSMVTQEEKQQALVSSRAPIIDATALAAKTTNYFLCMNSSNPRSATNANTASNQVIPKTIAMHLLGTQHIGNSLIVLIMQRTSMDSLHMAFLLLPPQLERPMKINLPSQALLQVNTISSLISWRVITHLALQILLVRLILNSHHGWLIVEPLTTWHPLIPYFIKQHNLFCLSLSKSQMVNLYQSPVLDTSPCLMILLLKMFYVSLNSHAIFYSLVKSPRTSTVLFISFLIFVFFKTSTQGGWLEWVSCEMGSITAIFANFLLHFKLYVTTISSYGTTDLVTPHFLVCQKFPIYLVIFLLILHIFVMFVIVPNKLVYPFQLAIIKALNVSL